MLTQYGGCEKIVEVKGRPSTGQVIQVNTGRICWWFLVPKHSRRWPVDFSLVLCLYYVQSPRTRSRPSQRYLYLPGRYYACRFFYIAIFRSLPINCEVSTFTVTSSVCLSVCVSLPVCVCCDKTPAEGRFVLITGTQEAPQVPPRLRVARIQQRAEPSPSTSHGQQLQPFLLQASRANSWFLLLFFKEKLFKSDWCTSHRDIPCGIRGSRIRHFILALDNFQMLFPHWIYDKRICVWYLWKTHQFNISLLTLEMFTFNFVERFKNRIEIRHISIWIVL